LEVTVPHPPGDLTTATVLFTDVVDSTATRIRLGEEPADRLYARHDRQLRAVVRVNRVCFIKSVGDGIMAVFDSATAALRAAAAIQHAVAAENRRSPVSVEIRSGLSSGDVIWTADDVQGLPPVEAARLASAAHSGQTLCSDVSVRLAFGRAGLDFKELGLLELKGLDKPLPAFEVLWWQQAPSPTAGLPVWLSHDEELPFLGRTREAATLKEWLDEPPSGASVAVVGGDAGIGKTRLVAEVVGRAVDRGQVVFVGRCTEPSTRPFQPIAEAIERVAATSPAVLLQAEPDTTLSELVRLTPDLANPPFMLSPPSLADPETEYFRLVDGLTRLLHALSSISPVVFVIDDIQWASEATIRLLLAVLQRLDDGAVQVIATMREAHLDVSSDVAHQLKGLLAFPNIVRLSLGPLAARDIAPALSVATDQVGPDVGDVAERVAAVTGGNAFLVTETIRGLRSGAGLPAVALPETITLFIASRVDRVGPAARELIHLVACSDRVESNVLRHATDTSEAEFVAALEEALDTGLVLEQSDGLLGIAHELARNAVTAGLSPARAAMMHRHLAEALTAVHPAIASTQPYLVARHLAAVAEAGDEDDVVRARNAAGDAARHAMTRLAHQEAVTWYQRSIALHDRLADADADGRIELLLALGEAQSRAGSRDARTTLIEAGRRAQALGRDDLVVSAALSGNRGFFSVTANADVELIDLLSTALTVVDPEAIATRAELLASLASELTWASDGDRRFAVSDEALELARQSGDERTLVKVLGLRNLTISAADTLDQRLHDTDELVRAAALTSDDLLRFQAAFQRAGTLLDLGDTGGIARMLAEAGQLAEALGQPQLQWLVAFSRAGLMLMTGDLADAEHMAERALRLGAAAGRRMEAVAFYSEQLAEIRRLQGRLGELVAGMRAAAGHLLIDPVNAVMRYLCEAGTDEVDELFDQAVAARGLPPRRDMAQRAALDNLAYVATRIERRDALPALYEALMPCADTFGHSAVAHPCGHHYLGVLAAGLGQPEKASRHFAAAAALHERAGAPFLLAESLIEWSEELARTGAPRSSVDSVRDRAAAALAGRAAAALTTRLVAGGS
jgi:class 3 adenylate cyclase/tetratricopeptide (TPR) repeat protein